MFQWRYKISWREPERLGVTWGTWWGKLWYWWLLAGSVQEKMRQDFTTQRKAEVRSQGRTVLERMAVDLAQNPDTPMPKADQWKEIAMNRLREQHQADYDNGYFRVRKMQMVVLYYS